MKKHFKTIIFILVAIGLLYFARENYSSHNVKKTFQACIMAQKQINQDITSDEAKKICEKRVSKQIGK